MNIKLNVASFCREGSVLPRERVVGMWTYHEEGIGRVNRVDEGDIFGVIFFDY